MIPILGDTVRLTDSAAADHLLGRVELVGPRQAKVHFRRLPWTPGTVPLPESRNFPLDHLERCRDPWVDLVNRKCSELDSVRLRIRATELWLGNQHGQLGNARTDLLPHQVCLVHEVVSRRRRRLLIAEEVGMGKTIESGMIIHALRQRRELSRCLVVCPAGQIMQWQDELQDKLQVRFEVYRHDIVGSRAFQFPMVIASLDTIKLDDPSKQLKGKSHREILLEAPDWDLVIFDEAHRLTAKDYGRKTDKTQNYQLAEALSARTRDFILLTGTPHDGNDSKFRNLLKALEPQVVFSRDPQGIYFGDLILKNRKSEARDAEGERLFKEAEVQKLALTPLSTGEAQFHQSLNLYLREGYGVAEIDPTNPRNRAIGFVMVVFQKLASSSLAAVRASLKRRLMRLSHTLNNKSQQPTDDERFAGEVEEVQADEWQEKLVREVFMEREIAMLKDLLSIDVQEEAKWVELMNIIGAATRKNPNEKLILFTEYRGTVAFLAASLSEAFGPESVGIIQGGMSAADREEVKDRFKRDPSCRFLISTEAGGEGINLQFCSLVVNYDLPWNPFRLVQRIGRVHRIGQRQNMSIINLRLHNPLDEQVGQCHEQRVNSAVTRLSEVTGLMPEDIRDQLLGFAQEFINYDKLFANGLSRAGTQSSESEIAEGIRQAEQAFRVAYETVFIHAVAPFNPERFAKLMKNSPTLEELRAWLEAWLRANGRRLMHRQDEDLYEFLLPDTFRHQVPPHERTVKGTFSRKRAAEDPSLPLLAFGHPSIDLLARDAVSPDAGAFLAATDSSTEDENASVVIVAILQTPDTEGNSRWNCHYFQRSPAGCWSQANASILDDWTPLSCDASLCAPELRESLETYIADAFPEIDFPAENLHYVAILIGQTSNSSHV
jgi:superfamily II DNA or RNA helicase